MRQFSLFGFPALIALLAGTAALAGPPAGFCPGATPLPDDVFESNNSMMDAVFISAGSGYPGIGFDYPINFNSDLDEDWFWFEGRASVMGENLTTYRISTRSDTVGSGIFLTDTGGDPLPEEGTGIRIQVFDSAGSLLTYSGQNLDTVQPTNDPPSLSNCDLLPLDLFFEVPADGDYFIRVSQCRAVPEFGVLELCIPDDPSIDIQFSPGEAGDVGVLSGVVTGANTGMGILGALIESNDLNQATFSLPGYGIRPDGSFDIADVVDGATPSTATITLAGYETATVDFQLVPSEVTPCDVALVPEGGMKDPPIFLDGFEGGIRRPGDGGRGVVPPCTQL